jgi:rfaE bifunctional protein kinase chain/domain
MTRWPAEEVAARLQRLLDEVAGRRVVVFGDLVLDEFLIGRIDRISREAPVLILEHQRLERVPGGGANAAANVAALGGTPLPVGAVGDDEAGEALTQLLRDRGIDVTAVQRLAGVATPVKTRILAGSSTSVRQQVVRVDRGLRAELPPPAARRLVDELAARVGDAEALLVSDYGHGVLAAAGRREPLQRAVRGGLPWTVDSRHHLADFRGMTAATPNLEEAAGALGRDIPDEDGAAAAAAAALCAALRSAHLIVTRGSRGMTVATAGAPPAHLPAFGSDEVADVTGAGDTVIAGVTLGLAAGASVLDAARLANVAAGLAVMKRGTATVTPEEIRAALGAARGEA